MDGEHGGPRPNSGRPSNARRHEGEIGGFTALCAEYLEQAFANLKALAEGGTMRRRTHLAAGTIFRKDVDRKADGTPRMDEKGKPIPIQVRVYPDLPAEQLVLVSEVEIPYAGDVKANELVVNRVAGTPIPAPSTEADLLDYRAAVEGARLAVAARRERLALEGPTTPAASADDAEPQ